MTESKETMEESLRQYEHQLEQVNEAISNSTDSSEELNALRDNLQELILLTRENLSSLNPEENSDDPLADEYALFKAEIENEMSNDLDDSSEVEDSLLDELKCLIGSKCRAPFREKWVESDNFSYHNALIMCIDSSDSLDNVKVKVMFVNPTCQEMIPCQYFLDGECKFLDEHCHFSHGHVVNFADLKEYKEPNFDSLKENASVLVKDNDKIWKRATVVSLNLEESQCCIRFEFGRKHDMVIDIQNSLPLEECAAGVDEDPQGCDELKRNEEFEEQRTMLIEKSLLSTPPPSKLGDWEKYTNSIGSKLMANMGYVVGTGLGKRGDGRIEPVTAVVLPPGKSLDHCMELREAAGGDPNLFNAEKLQKKLKRKMLAKNEKKKKQAVLEKQDKNDVFSFLNQTLGDNTGAPINSAEKDSVLKQTSTQALNVKELKISEDVQRLNYDLMVLREKLSRQKSDTVGHNTLKKKVIDKQKEMDGMHLKLREVQREQNYRQTMKELAEF